jgi:hypothetical protein
MSEENVILDLPECPLADFLTFMSDIGAPEWVWSYMEMCGRFGMLHAEPSRFMLARPVNSAIPIDDLNCLADLDPARYPDRELTNTHDAWHILFASGGIEHFFDLAPYELPKLIWQRDGKGGARIYDFQRIKKLIHKNHGII